MTGQRTYDIPLGRLFTVAPGIPTTDMARTIEHYQRLGFTFSAPGTATAAEADFAIGKRDGVELHSPSPASPRMMTRSGTPAAVSASARSW